MAGDSSENMMKQAQHIWSMLDDMAAQNPEGYRKFIDKHLKEGREAMRLPEPHMCVQTNLNGPSGCETIFINIMDWPRIPAPKTDDDPIPTMGGPILPAKDEDGSSIKVVPVAFNSQLLKDFGLESSLAEERRMLINLAIDYVEDQNKVTLSRNFYILPKSVRCKGPVSVCRNGLTKRLGSQDSEFEKQLSEMEKSFGPIASGCKDSLLKELSTVGNEGSNNGFSLPTGASSSFDKSEIRLPGDDNRQVHGVKLVEEISSTTAALVKPEFEMWITDENGSIPRQLKAKIKLPGIASVRDCVLEMSDTDLYLLVPDRYELAVTFLERTVSASENRCAKFNKRTSCLTVSLPTAR